MSWRSWVPYRGDTAVRKKIRELDQAGVGMPMFIVLMFQKSIELFLKDLGSATPLPLWLTFFLTGVLVLLAWIYDRQIVEKAKEKSNNG